MDAPVGAREVLMDNLSLAARIAGTDPKKMEAFLRNVMFQMGIDDLPETIRRINAGEWVVSAAGHNCYEEDGIIYASFVTGGWTGSGWVEQFKKRGIKVEDLATEVLRSDQFVPTDGVRTRVRVLKGELFEDSQRTLKNIRAEAAQYGFVDLGVEAGCILRDMISDWAMERMGLKRIIAMHEPIELSNGETFLIGASSYEGPRLSVFLSRFSSPLSKDYGFAFALR